MLTVWTLLLFADLEVFWHLQARFPFPFSAISVNKGTQTFRVSPIAVLL